MGIILRKTETLTENSQIYCAFCQILRPGFPIKDWEIENYYGIVNFPNTVDGRYLHNEFVNWAFDADIKITKSNKESFEDLYFHSLEENWEPGLFTYNYHPWVISDSESLYILMEFIKKSAFTVKSLNKK